VNKLMQEASRKLERGASVAQECREVLEKIVTNTDELSARVENIASASREQSSGVDEIGRAVHLLEQSTQVNAAESSNTARTAEHLGAQAKSLNQSIFQLQTMINGRAGAAGTMVNSFVWRDRYALGVEKMDDEHKILIEKINALVSGINAG